jgi:site-specific recombinase XerD
MKWSYWISLYIRTFCVARGLRTSTLEYYEAALKQFSEWIRVTRADKPPDLVSPRDVLEYLQHLRDARGNGDSAVNSAVVVLRSFYRAMVALDYLEYSANPMVGFPTIKAVPRKLPVALALDQVERLMAGPQSDTIIGLRDGALLALLYGTGIRATECATLRCGQVDFTHLTITVIGKGGHERTIPLELKLANVLRNYAHARGPALPAAPFFRSRFGRPLSRGAVYERVRTWGQRSRIGIPLSPHRLRHTFATHLVRNGEALPVVQHLLGHRLITSTQIYVHLTAEDLRSAVARHPIGSLLATVEHLLPTARLPFQRTRPFPLRR